MSTCLSDSLSVSLSVCLSVCLSLSFVVCVSLCLSLCLSLSLSVYLSVCLSVCLSLSLSLSLSVCLSVSLSVCLSICLSSCLSVFTRLIMRFGDVEDFRGLSIRLQLSNTFSESLGQWWFSVDSVSLLYNTSEEAVFNASDVYAPASSSYHCDHVSSLQRYSALLLPSTDPARRWSITFTNFQIQAFNVTAGGFSPASVCTTFLTPAILMGLIMSLILLLVLAYALHMVIHLKHIEHDDQRKADVYFPQSPEHCCVENDDAEKNILSQEDN
uniref:ATPase H+ transporting accessory protein 1 like n=1 Tax=Sander lucioperca TaxID=283035 RepID=A0A8C9XYX2_SANLU